MTARSLLAVLVLLALTGCSLVESDPRGRWHMDEWKLPRDEGAFGRIRSSEYRL